MIFSARAYLVLLFVLAIWVVCSLWRTSSLHLTQLISLRPRKWRAVSYGDNPK